MAAKEQRQQVNCGKTLDLEMILMVMAASFLERY